MIGTRFAGTLARLSTPGAFVVTRGAEPTDDGHGRLVPGATTTLDVRGSLQPVTGRDLLRLPEGLRSRELIALYTATELRTADAASNLPADVIAYRGARYEVQHVERWADIAGYWKVVAAKVGA